MEIFQDPHRKIKDVDEKIPYQSTGNKRRLSVSIVESEGRRWRNVKDDDPSDNDERKLASNMHELMTQDCIEWDEGRHNIDLRKLADPNFQTPSALYGSHQTVLPTTDEDTAASISPKRSSLLRTSFGSNTSHCDSQSPVPRRRRQRRRRESLDLIARHIPDKGLIKGATRTSFTIPQGSSKEILVSKDPTVAVVSTERHTKRCHEHSVYHPKTNNETSRHATSMQDVTNIIPHPSRGKELSASRDGTTDFADLLHEIQTNNVAVVCNPIRNTNSTEDRTNKGTLEIISDENQVLQRSIPVVDKFVHHPTSLSVHENLTNVDIKRSQKFFVASESKRAIDDDDEFEDVTFSSDDLATIDALVHTIVPPKATNDPIVECSVDMSKHVSVRTKANAVVADEESDPFGDIPDIDIEAILTGSNHKSLVTTTPVSEPKLLPANIIKENVLHASASHTANKLQPLCPSQISSDKGLLESSTLPAMETFEDPFDDLPDFDVDAFVSKQEFVLPTMSCTADDDDEFPDVDFASLDLEGCTVPQVTDPPPTTAPLRNRRQLEMDANTTSFLTCTRYKVLDITENASTYTKTVSLAAWTTEMLMDEDQKSRLMHHPTDQKRNHRVNSREKWNMVGVVYLRGEWYYTRLQTDDTIHIVSLSGRFCTDQLPIVFHTCPPQGSDPDDDLLLIVHPDLLLTPTIISETVGCSRRAVLKNRMGATGLTSKAALDGTMRHALFEATMKTKDFTNEGAIAHIQSIVRDNAESLLACNISTREAEKEILKFLPQLRRFANDYTEFGSGVAAKDVYLESHGAAKSSNFLAKSVEAVEEPVISPELGLKGNVDMLVKATSKMPSQILQSPSFMGIELKTGHHQNAQNIHVAQLALYVIMLQTRYGVNDLNDDKNTTSALKSGVLLYMNNNSIRAIHIAPIMSEIKSLVGMRNLVAIETIRAHRPRGVRLSYEGNDAEPSNATIKVDLLDAMPPELPDLLPNSFSCKKCYSNRECMMYTAASRNARQNIGQDESHRDLLRHFTGHLVDEEYEYFNKWDRLIDLEADASSSLIARSWLRESNELENETSTCISSLIFDPEASSPEAVFDESWFALIGFKRSSKSPTQTPFSDVGFEPGCRVVIGTDSRSVIPPTPLIPHHQVRHQMHLVRGSVHKVTETHIYILASRDDLSRIEVFSGTASSTTTAFRMDKENLPTGITTLRQNLVNLFTADKKSLDTPGTQVEQSRLSWLRDVLIRLRRPTFDRSLVKYMFAPSTCTEPIPGCDLMDLRSEFSKLNEDQQAAVEQVFTAQDYTIVQGLPGSGKTSTIAFVARLLAAHGKRVLVTSYTHAAVDNVLLKLIKCGVSTDGNNGHALVRVGKKASCHVGVHATLASVVALRLETGLNTQEREHTTPSSEYLRIAMSNARIVGVTALTIPRSSLLFREHFDVVIVDEAGQISQPAIIGTLLAADSFLLVGDHMQLPPLVVSELAEKAEYGESMLKRLADKHPDCVSQLTYQYRMHQNICQLSNDVVYKGKLKCANDLVAKKMLTLDRFPRALEHSHNKESFLWLHKSIDPCNAVTFLDTDKIDIRASNADEESVCSLESSNNRRSGGSIVNETEVSIVKILIEGLMTCGLDASSIGVISPFRAQLRLFDENESIHNWIKEGLEVSTIDRFQGRDKSVIVLSFVRSNTKGKVGHLLEDFRRINVAVTRAKYKLIMVGSYSTLYKGSGALKLLLDRVMAENFMIQLPSTDSILFAPPRVAIN